MTFTPVSNHRPKHLVFLLGAALFVAAMAFSPPLHASEIQMLPPVTENTANPCAPGNPRLLSWDGKSPINCTNGITASGGTLSAGSLSVANTGTFGGNVAIGSNGTHDSLCLNGACMTSFPTLNPSPQETNASNGGIVVGPSFLSGPIIPINGSGDANASRNALPLVTHGAEQPNCPPGSVMTGIIVNTAGTCEHQCNADGPIIGSIQITCTPLSNFYQQSN